MTEMLTGEDHRQFQHGALPVRTSSEESRDLFVKSLKLYVSTEIAPGVKTAYELNVLPELRKQTGREPTDYNEIRQHMEKQPFYQLWSAIQRSSQELMWRSIQAELERQPENLRLDESAPSQIGGTLQTDPTLEIPRYANAVDTHCMPGGYHFEQADNDLSAGALYDRGVWVYAMGRMGPLNDGMGLATIDFIEKHHSDLKPKRILDMGCTVGHGTLPYCDRFPEAEVYGVDLGAPMVRYAHQRAEALGKKVHFSQQNAEATNFPDGYFDLIVSHILVHETSNSAIRRIMKECHRLLAPGGLVVHQELEPYEALPPFAAFMLDWETRNNNEPFWGGSHKLDYAGLTTGAGFSPEEAFQITETVSFSEEEWFDAKDFHAGDMGGMPTWYFWGARKKG